MTKVAIWFAKMDRLKAGRFMAGGRKQPRTPRRKVFD